MVESEYESVDAETAHPTVSAHATKDALIRSLQDKLFGASNLLPQGSLLLGKGKHCAHLLNKLQCAIQRMYGAFGHKIRGFRQVQIPNSLRIVECIITVRLLV